MIREKFSITRVALPTAITLILLGLLVRSLMTAGAESEGLDWRWTALSGPWLALGSGFYILVNFLRALRFSLLLPNPERVHSSLLPLGFALSFLNNVLPFRGGELAFIFIMQRAYSLRGAEATAMIFLARILDYLSVILWFVPLALISLPSFPKTVNWPLPGLPASQLIILTLIMALVFGLLVFSIVGLGQRGMTLLEKSLDRLGLADNKVSKPILRFGRKTVEALQTVQHRGQIFKALLLSITLWLGIFAWQFSLAKGLGSALQSLEEPAMSLSFNEFIVGATFGVFSKAIPLPTLGGHGITEAGFSTGLSLVGLSPNAAVASSLGITFFTLLMSTLAGGIALWKIRRMILAQRD